MKINWGTGLVIGMLLFIVFILTLVITMSTDEKYYHELVTEDYYQKEMELQDNITALQQGREMRFRVATNAEGITVQADESAARNYQGSISLYRPSDETLDFELPLVLEEGTMLVPAERLPAGRWNLEIRWEYQGKTHLQREKLTF